MAIANRWTMAARTSWTLGAFFVIAVAFCTGPGAALGEETSAHRFVGAAKCKTCHKKEGIGNQYGIWLESKHAKAYETLAGEQAAEWAADVGIADPQADEKCVKCHVTAYGVPEERLSRKFKKTLGVQCEACHGAGKDYRKKKIMIDQELAVSKGLVLQSAEVCTTCHNDESPAWKPDFDQAVEEIVHPVPEGYDPLAEGEAD
ncbi:MAG: cytochrome c family protein [Deltaproteobacteria bacterium]|nr:cytochrome c family protein [Deltaproteobacteria bacterium]